MSKYIKVDDLQKYCDNQKDHAITPNDFQRMNFIELPDKYGRLIDADECGKVLLDKYTEGLDKWDELYRAGYRYALKYFSQVPTIVEANN